MELRAISIGRHARARLAPAQEFRVLAAYRHAVYLALAAGVVCVGGRAIGRGPLNLVVAAGPECWRAAWRPGAVGRVEPARLVLANARVGWSDCPAWRGRVEPCGGGPETARWVAREIERVARCAGAPGSLLLSPAPPRGVRGETGRRLRFGLRLLGEWLAGHRAGPPPVTTLLGLGPGLTPSGDDVLVGSLLALTVLGARRRRDALAAAVLGAGPRRTNRISFEHLCIAAVGAASDRWCELALAIAEGCDLRRAIAAVAAVGHSSGWDALAGFHAVMRADPGRTRAQGDWRSLPAASSTASMMDW